MSRIRPEMTAAGREVRAFFAPVDRATSTPAAFDPAQYAWFDLDSPPAPWRSLGSIHGFRRSSATRTEALRGGMRGAAVAQFRSQLDARLEFDFREWGKLQMALASGCEHRNVLTGAAVPLAEGSTAEELALAPDDVENFTAGELVAVDADYAAQTGYIGTGISGAYVADATQITTPDYVRAVTFNVARIADVRTSSLLLAQPLLGGTPQPAAKVQKCVGFADGEGGSFFQEWSGLFVIPEEAGGRLVFYYPRLQACAPAGERDEALAGALRLFALHASYVSLPVSSVDDGQPALCHRFYFPVAAAALY